MKNTPVSPSPAVTSEATSSASSSSLEARVAAYLRNKSGDVSLKQIQSRFKEEYLTCRRIYDLLVGWGYVLRGSGPTYSTYVVPVSEY